MKMTMFKTDAQIQQDVIDELERDWRFRPAEVGVEVDQGIVTLNGTVSSYTKLVAAADMAAEIAGVKGVANELTVRTPGTAIPNDAELAGAVRNALKWDADIPDDKIEVIVRHGAVTLKGNVDYWYQRKAAGDSAARLSGVAAINNHIVIVPPTLSDRSLHEQIERALRRRMPQASEEMQVDVKDGLVTLSGTVRFYVDRLQAEKTAWMTEGVRNVDNKLTTIW